MAEDSRLRVSSEGSVTVVAFKDASILDSATIQRIGAELYALVESGGATAMVLDFNDVRFLSSQALGVLLTLRQKSEARKVKVALTRIRPELLRVFKITNLDKLFTFFEDRDKAVASLS